MFKNEISKEYFKNEQVKETWNRRKNENKRQLYWVLAIDQSVMIRVKFLDYVPRRGSEWKIVMLNKKKGRDLKRDERRWEK